MKKKYEIEIHDVKQKIQQYIKQKQTHFTKYS